MCFAANLSSPPQIPAFLPPPLFLSRPFFLLCIVVPFFLQHSLDIVSAQCLSPPLFFQKLSRAIMSFLAELPLPPFSLIVPHPFPPLFPSVLHQSIPTAPLSFYHLSRFRFALASEAFFLGYFVTFSDVENRMSSFKSLFLAPFFLHPFFLVFPPKKIFFPN